jgi:hypothetical protein
MAQSIPTIDLAGKRYQGTAAPSGGTFTADYPIPTDQGARLVAVALFSSASGGHLLNFGTLRAEYAVANKNGTLSAPTAITTPGSTNPLNSSTTGEAAAHVQASDTAFSNVGGGIFPLLQWSISATNARCTFTNNSSTSITANVTIVIQAILVGST